MKQFKFANNVLGWLVCVIGAATYLLTMEPTASFWDCPEFIACGAFLEVGHPPGNPIFMLIQNLFAQFAPGRELIAVAVNVWSALASALTLMFLYWTIVRLARKMIHAENGVYSLGQSILLFGAGLVGALAYGFTDSFWFNAVEAEVYASSSFFTALVFWAIFKWEDIADEPQGDRWLILIAYLTGLSVAVHLLNLLIIPAMALVYYFKKKPDANFKGTLIALSVSAVILGVVMYGLMLGLIKVVSWSDLLFVNVFGFSFNTGVIAYIILISALFVWSLYLSYKSKNIILNKLSFVLIIMLLGVPFISDSVLLGILLSAALIVVFFFTKINFSVRILNIIAAMLMVFVVGYSSYALIFIRSNANPPIDENAPDNIFSLQGYINREQYGDRPLLHGQTYNAELKLRIEGNQCIPISNESVSIWRPAVKKNPHEKDRYVAVGKKQNYLYDDKFTMLFPRMHSSDPQHVKAYKVWGEVKGRKVTHNRCGQSITVEVPTFAENLRFFFSYQVNHMYWRYFMWNFSGRQNDVQGHGEVDKGNWITGFNFIDTFLVGDQTNLPPYLKDNKARNAYYMLPFLLGILGIVYQLMKKKEGLQNFSIVFMLFFMTGLAIIVYLNQTPFQPRERDYAYVGSFYAFAIWIGLGVMAVAEFINKLLKNKTVSASAATLLCLSVPAILASGNWDDHDRSNRYTCRDFGYNYLISLAPNAIVFSNGDNDTFPLWYLQEVEQERTDVRVCNLSYLQTDWYIDQMKREAYDSKPLPISWTGDKYIQGTNEMVYVYDLAPELDLHTALAFVTDDDAQIDGQSIIPTSLLYLPVDAEQVIKTGTVSEKQRENIVSRIDIALKRRVAKSELMILEMLDKNNWERPIYFANTVSTTYYLGLDKYLRNEGMASRIVPIAGDRRGTLDTEIMFDNMMNKFRWGGIDNPNIYLEENILRMCKTLRFQFIYLVEALIQENKKDKALEALEYCLKVIPGTTVPHDHSSIPFAYFYILLEQQAKAEEFLDFIANDCCLNLNWYASLLHSPAMFGSIQNELEYNLAGLERTLDLARRNNSTELIDKYKDRYQNYIKRFGYQ